jgi:hypothetical protein
MASQYLAVMNATSMALNVFGMMRRPIAPHPPLRFYRPRDPAVMAAVMAAVIMAAVMAVVMAVTVVAMTRMLAVMAVTVVAMTRMLAVIVTVTRTIHTTQSQLTYLVVITTLAQANPTLSAPCGVFAALARSATIVGMEWEVHAVRSAQKSSPRKDLAGIGVITTICVQTTQIEQCAITKTNGRAFAPVVIIVSIARTENTIHAVPSVNQNMSLELLATILPTPLKLGLIAICCPTASSSKAKELLRLAAGAGTSPPTTGSCCTSILLAVRGSGCSKTLA